MYNQLLIDIQLRKEGAWEKLINDKEYNKIFNAYCNKYASNKNSKEFRDTLAQEMFRVINDKFKPKQVENEKEKNDFAWKFLSTRLYYKILDLINYEVKWNKKHVELEEINAISSPSIDLENRIMDLKLPALEKVALLLKFSYSWETEEIAKLLNIAPATVGSLLKRAMKHVK